VCGNEIAIQSLRVESLASSGRAGYGGSRFGVFLRAGVVGMRVDRFAFPDRQVSYLQACNVEVGGGKQGGKKTVARFGCAAQKNGMMFGENEKSILERSRRVFT